MKNSSTTRMMRLVAASAAGVLLAACASMGRPEGGARDVEPPVYVRATPSMNALNVNKGRISIEFNENVQLKDQLTKVVVSPAQVIQPQVLAVGRRVNVTLRDTLIPNTTYTIDFSDAIADLNEGNELDGFAYAFSTGPTIDTLQISGMVFEAATLEPAQGMIVGVYSNLSDTAITTLPLERITKTNQLGQFTIRNLKEGTYRIFALNDQNRDYKWDRTEDVAFYDMTITPTAERVTVADTLKSSEGADSIVQHEVTRFYPNDILLTWFNENYKSQYLQKYERPQRTQLNITMGAPAECLPTITLLNNPDQPRYDISRWSVLNASATLDTLQYWITDKHVQEMDTLIIEARYQKTDTLDQLSWTTDTLKLTLRGNAKKKAEEKKKKDKNDTVPEPTPLMSVSIGGTTQEVNMPLLLKSSSPIVDFNQEGVHMSILEDTLWVDVEPPRFVMIDSLKPMLMAADYKWEPGRRYTVTIDSLAMTDALGLHNKDVKKEFATRALEDYSSVTFTLTGLKEPAMVELLTSQDKPVARTAVVDGKAVFKFLQPGTYYARMFIDRNNNGKYDTGVLLDSVQPEEVYYFPKKIALKKNWDLADQPWNIYEFPVDRQKPTEIKKNKPKRKAGEIPEEQTDEEEDEYEYDPSDPFGKRNNRNRNRSNTGRLPQVDRNAGNLRGLR